MNIKTLFLAILLGGSAAANLTAATWTVTNAVDGGPGSLRAAVNAAVSAGGNQLITFAPALAGQTLYLTQAGDSTGQSAFLVCDGNQPYINLTIQGLTNSPGITLAIGGTNQMRLFLSGISASTLTLNNLTLTGGNLPNGWGGAVQNAGATVNLNGCTLTGNSANLGGAVFNNQGYMTLINCTIAGNSVTTYGQGGGLYFYVGSQTTLINVTVTGNYAPQGGGIYVDATPYPVLINTIVANDSAGINFPEICGRVSSSSTHNLCSDPGITGGSGGNGAGNMQNGVNGNLVGVDPQLGPLQNNGGPSLTAALLAGSPAVDAGTSSSAPTVDQRGVLRPQFGAVDIGAFEQRPFDTGQTVVAVGGAYWYLGLPVQGNDLSTYYQLPNQLDVNMGEAASSIGQANNGTVLVATAAGQVFVRTGSLTGQGSAWQPETAVTAGDGATWFLGPDGDGADPYVYRWAAGGLPEYSNGALSSLWASSTGQILGQTKSGIDYYRVGSNTGIGTSWDTLQGALVVTTPTDENDGTSDPRVGTGTSLREALIYAESLSGPQTITFAPALAGQRLTLTNGWSGGSDSSALVIAGNIFVQGLTNSPGVTLAIGAGTARRHFYVNGSAALSLQNLTLTGGQAPDYGGAVWNFGALTVNACTFNGNSAGAEGGAIQSWGGSGGSTLLVVSNSTFTGNSAGTGEASAISAGASTNELLNLTITGNTAGSGSGALWIYDAPLTMQNCLVAGNSPEGAQTHGTGGFTAASANNLVGGGSWNGLVNGVNGNQLGVAAAELKLGTLANNGGPTPTIALLAGSPALNAGTAIGAPKTDQRGLPRDAWPDIGAYEYQAPVIFSAPQATFATGISNHFDLVASGNGASVFSATGLPPGVILSSAGLLSGIPPVGSSGTYPISVTANNGITPNGTQNFTLTVVEESSLAAWVGFATNGLGWALNGDSVDGGPTISNDVFTPTDGTAGETRSAWFGQPLYVGAFAASFTYQDVATNGADGTAFVIQNDPRGLSAVGAGGGGLGYIGISPSVAVMLDIYAGASGGPSGWLVATNGLGNGAGYSSTNYQNTAPVNLDGGDPIAVNLRYSGGVLKINLTDTVTSATFTTNVVVNIPRFVGTNTAWVGITGAEGGVLSHQTVSNFQYVPLTTLTVTPGASGTLVLSWPESILGYTVQTQTNLTNPNPADWVSVPATIVQTNSLNEAVVPVSATGAQFYRLVLP